MDHDVLGESGQVLASMENMRFAEIELTIGASRSIESGAPSLLDAHILG